MLRKVLWIAAACAAVLVALAVSRSLDFDQPTPKAPDQPVAVEPPATPAAAVVPEVPLSPVPPPPPPPPTEDEQQIQDDAAATGMTTMEPEEAPAAETPPI